MAVSHAGCRDLLFLKVCLRKVVKRKKKYDSGEKKAPGKDKRVMRGQRRGRVLHQQWVTMARVDCGMTN